MSKATTATEAMWAARVREWRASGETAAAFAAREGVSGATLRWYASRLRHLETPGFVQLVARRAATPEGKEPTLTVEVGPARIRLAPGFDAKLLAEVVDVLGGAR